MYSEIAPPELGRSSHADPARGYMLAGAIVVIELIVLVAGLLLGGELGSFAAAGLQYGPFLPLALLAQVGERQLWAKIVSYLYALFYQGAVGLYTLALVLIALAPMKGGQIDLTGFLGDAGNALKLLALIVILFVLFLLSSAVLLRPVRVFLARWLPIDPDKLSHTLALWIVLFVAFSAYAQLIFLGGNPPLLTAIQTNKLDAGALGGASALEQNLQLVYGLIWLAPVALAGAGWPLNRSFGATLKRLGLVRPTRKQVIYALGGAVLLAIVVTGFGAVISGVWTYFGWPQTDAEAFNQLIGGSISPIGALVIGVTAGLGEEVAVRGLLQPRLGLLLSSLAFSALHAYQYGFDSLLPVFILGAILGVIRARTNTTTSAIVHGTYDAVLVLATWASTLGGS